MEPTDFKKNAREAYAAYGKVTDFKNYQGLPMPTFDELPEKIREAWIAAARTAYLRALAEAGNALLAAAENFD